MLNHFSLFARVLLLSFGRGVDALNRLNGLFMVCLYTWSHGVLFGTSYMPKSWCFVYINLRHLCIFFFFFVALHFYDICSCCLVGLKQRAYWTGRKGSFYSVFLHTHY